MVARHDRFWLAVAVATGIWLHLAYLATHTYPAFGAGLFLEIADQITAGGYGLPATIPGYTDGGVPFAYPPLMFYVAAVVRDLTGVGSYTYSSVVPGLLVTAYLIPYYFTARELLGAPHRAGLATVLFAATPDVLRWHISAGGIVRAGALLLALAGAYAGIRVYRDGDRRWLVAAVVLFGLTVLAHPTYAVFFGATHVLLWLRFSRSFRGLAAGALVAGGGVALAAPWWLQVVVTHGPDIFTAAAGTHSGLGGGLTRLRTEFVRPLVWNLELGFYLAAYVGGLYALATRRWFLPAWLVSAGYLLGKPRFQFVAGSMLAALFVFEVVLGPVRSLSVGYGPDRRTLALCAAGLLAVSAVGVGTLHAAGAMPPGAVDRSQPAFVDGADDDAMAWAAENTHPSASFVVLGDAAEWFPHRTDRTILVGPWGVEWTTPERYRHHLELYNRLSHCGDAACVSSHLRDAGYSPDYLYVPKGEYTLRGRTLHQSPAMRGSLIDSPTYRMVYENRGVMVFRVEDDRPRPIKGPSLPRVAAPHQAPVDSRG